MALRVFVGVWMCGCVGVVGVAGGRRNSQPLATEGKRARPMPHDDSTAAVNPAEKGKWAGGALASVEHNQTGKCRTSQ